MLKALLFDLDGTLFDSTDANVAAYSHAFADSGIAFDAEAYKQSFGLRFEEMIHVLAPNATASQATAIADSKPGYYQANLHLVRPNNGLLALLKSAQPYYKTALVTTARQTNVLNLLEYFSIDSNLFTVIITAENVTAGKPDPECYLLAMEKLGVPPADCCIFEDSAVGIAAATAAGGQIIQVHI